MGPSSEYSKEKQGCSSKEHSEGQGIENYEGEMSGIRKILAAPCNRILAEGRPGQ